MSPSNIRAAIKEARAFGAKAEALLDREKEDADHPYRTYPLTGSRESGSTRRASLDLTRALAEMRKP